MAINDRDDIPLDGHCQQRIVAIWQVVRAQNTMRLNSSQPRWSVPRGHTFIEIGLIWEIQDSTWLDATRKGKTAVLQYSPPSLKNLHSFFKLLC